jgi:hypothetical protein
VSGDPDRHVGSLRFVTNDTLMQFHDAPPSPGDGFERGGVVNLTPWLHRVSWNETWTGPHEGGLTLNSAALEQALEQLLAATNHAYADAMRLKRLKALTETRSQDHGAIFVKDGVARVFLRSYLCEVESPALKGLDFGIGRKDAETLVRALRLMRVGRRRECAKKCGKTLTPPRWIRDGDLNVVTNGDIGFAFPDPLQGRRPVQPRPLLALASSRQQSNGLLQQFQNLEILTLSTGVIKNPNEVVKGPGDMNETVRLLRNDEHEVFLATTQLGRGAHGLQLRDDPNGQQWSTFSGPLGAAQFNLLDLSRVLTSLQHGDAKLEVLTREENDVVALRIEQSADGYTVRAWVTAEAQKTLPRR